MPSSRYLVGSVTWYSVLIVAGMCLAILLAAKEEKRLALPQDTVLDLALRVIPLGILGARLYYVAFAWDSFRQQPLSILYIWQGGLAIYGGLIGGALAVVLYARRKGLSLLTLLDAIVPGVPLAQGIGRWGNFFNMEAYGRPVTNPAWQFFPFAVLIDTGSGLRWFQATFFYESVWDLLVFVVLWRRRKRILQQGDTFWSYLLLYGAGRVVIEGLRSDSLMGRSLRVSQVLSAALCVGVLCLLVARLISAHRAGPLLWVLPALLLAFGWVCAGGISALSLSENGSTLLCTVFAVLVLISAFLLDRALRRASTGGETTCRQPE